MGLEPPYGTTIPIQGISERLLRPMVFITPRLDANPDPGAQWSRARRLLPTASSGAMQQAGGEIQMVRYGNDGDYLYLRIELASPVSEHHIEVHIHTPLGAFLLSKGQDQASTFLYRLANGSHISLGPVKCNTADGLMEVAVPLARLGLPHPSPGSKLAISVYLDPHSPRSERLPAEGVHEIELVTASRG